MKQLTCILTANDCYKANQTIKPKGVMVHSTGANNPMLRRYVQPIASTPDRAALLSALGTNANGNSWNRSGTNACVHGFIGKLADGTVAVAQTLPWNWRGWHAGTGTSGKSANDTHISFEICEDGLADRVYFDQVYRAAVELTAMLCKQYGLDPLADGVVICHSEGYRRGIASGHADVEHWFPKHGKTMNHFRVDVAAEMKGKPAEVTAVNYQGKITATAGLNCRTSPVNGTVVKTYPYGTIVTITKEQSGWGCTSLGWVSLAYIEKIASATRQEDDDMDKERFKELWMEMRKDLQDNDGAQWSEAARKWAVSSGLVEGGGNANYMWEDLMTREQLVTVLYRFAQMVGKV